MPATVRSLKRRAASQPARRTVEVKLEGDYEGWEFSARADFKAARVADLNSGDVDRIIKALEGIVISHNFPDAETDELADSMADVDMEALAEVITGLFDAIGKLPKR